MHCEIKSLENPHSANTAFLAKKLNGIMYGVECIEDCAINSKKIKFISEQHFAATRQRDQKAIMLILHKDEIDNLAAVTNKIIQFFDYDIDLDTNDQLRTVYYKFTQQNLERLGFNFEDTYCEIEETYYEILYRNSPKYAALLKEAKNEYKLYRQRPIAKKLYRCKKNNLSKTTNHRVSTPILAAGLMGTSFLTGGAVVYLIMLSSVPLIGQVCIGVAILALASVGFVLSCKALYKFMHQRNKKMGENSDAQSMICVGKKIFKQIEHDSKISSQPRNL